GDPMVPTHATKQGVRYRYYVSQPYLRGLATPPIGAIVRVPAPDIEAVVTTALREYLARSNTAAAKPSSADQPSIRAMVARIEVRNSNLAVWLMRPGREGTDAGIGLGIGDELGNRLDRHRGVHLYGKRLASNARNRRDVANEIEIELVVERRVDRVHES